jgi:hypothetical protein
LWIETESAKPRLAVRVPRDGEPFLFPAHHRERYLGGAGKRQRVRRGRGEIDDTAAHEWAAIIDPTKAAASAATPPKKHLRAEYCRKNQ